ncbi:MAG: DUF952 domain-containing protein [Anaerolineales bacterium]
MSHLLFHLVSPQDWQRAQAAGIYRAASLEKEGFIHLSAAHQIRAVHRNLYHDRDDLLLLVIDETRLESPLRWEPPAGSLSPDLNEQRFPHLYGPLNLDAVIQVVDLSTTDLKEVLHRLGTTSLKTGFQEPPFGKLSLFFALLALGISGIVLTHALIRLIMSPAENFLMPWGYSLLTILSTLFALLGGTLGIAALVQEKGKGFAIAGCLLNLVLFVLLCMLALTAMMAAMPIQ